jgi:hypothetical protein
MTNDAEDYVSYPTRIFLKLVTPVIIRDSQALHDMRIGEWGLEKRVLTKVRNLHVHDVVACAIFLNRNLKLTIAR